MELQGYSIYADDSDPYQCGFLDAFSELSARQVRAMAGKAMHLRAVGACMLFAIACLRRP